MERHVHEESYRPIASLDTVNLETDLKRPLTGSDTSRTSTPYLVALTLTVMLASYANYLKDRLDPSGFTLGGQAPGIYLPILAFPLIFVLWLLCRSWSPRNPWLLAFLGALAAAWIVHFILIRIHNDLYPQTIWLLPLIIAMLAWKPPTWEASWIALRVLAWTALGIMILTFALEQLGLVPQFFTGGPELTEFELENYWLPLREVFGLDGRWPGPFGHISKTAFMSSVIIIIAVADRGWQRWLLLAGGMIGMLLTGGRGGYLALVAGLAVLLIFARTGPFSRIPVTLRLITGAALATAGAFTLYSLGSLGLTGRQELWAGYLNLWQTSPLIGVGQSGISTSPQIVTWMESSWMDAHSLYIEQLTQFGILGSLFIGIVLLLSITLTIKSAWRGHPAPAALLTTYMVAGLTDLLHENLQILSTPILLLILISIASSTLTNTTRSRQRMADTMEAAPESADQ